MSILTLSHLCVEDASRPILTDVSFTIEPGEILGLIGASGSGKSLTARALAGLLPKNLKAKGSLVFKDHTTSIDDQRSFAQWRGQDIGLIFQDPAGTFNPLMTLGDHVAEPLQLCGALSKSDARDEARHVLNRVGFPTDIDAFDRYPHEVSGGQRQRAMIAAALALKPRLLIADEPTTALDVTIEHDILMLLRRLVNEEGLGILLISHDLSALAQIADRVALMRDGQIREIAALPLKTGTAPELEQLFAMGHKPSLHRAVSPDHSIVHMQAIRKSYPLGTKGLLRKREERLALDDVSLTLNAGEITALVGESGSGKSSIARILAGLDHAYRGTHTWFEPERIGRVQMVFQDPTGSLNPRWPIGKSIAEPLANAAPEDNRIKQAANEVGLDLSLLDRFPHQLSGGQAQRAAIARAIIVRPSLLILDEPISALDFEIRDQILSLLDQLRAMHGIAMLFITHDLNAAIRIADRLVVLDQGRIVEAGAMASVLAAPAHAKTRAMLNAAPALTRART